MRPKRFPMSSAGPASGRAFAMVGCMIYQLWIWSDGEMLFAYMHKAEPTTILQAAYFHHISLDLKVNVAEDEDVDVEMDVGTLKRAY